MTEKNKINAIQLKDLLHEISHLRPDICIRFRLIGEMWQANYFRIVKLTKSGLILNDEVANQLFVIPDLNMIMQLELDHAFQQYQPNFHYSITFSLAVSA